MGVLRGSFKGFGCPKRHPDALLAKTMGGGGGGGGGGLRGLVVLALIIQITGEGRDCLSGLFESKKIYNGTGF